MDTRQLLTDAAQALGLGDELRLVGPHQYRGILEQIIHSRTTLTKHAVSAPWWWEALRPPTAACQPHDPLAVLADVVPPHEWVWFVVEANDVPPKREGNFWLYESRVGAITKVLRELPPCEYYLVHKTCDWLLCENHHGTLIASGEPMAARLRGLAAETAL